MKRKLILMFALSYFLIAATNEQIISHFKTQINLDGLEYKVVDRQTIDNYLGFEFVTVEISPSSIVPENAHHDSRIKKLNVITKDNLIFPDAIDVIKNKSLKEDIENMIFYKKLGLIYQQEKQLNIIELSNNETYPTLVMFLNPTSIYSIKEFNNLNEYMKTNNIKIILTAVHDKNSFGKISQIYKEIPQTKDNEAKLKILNKYFNTDIIDNIKVTDKEVDRLSNITQKYVDAGLFSIPLVLEEKYLLAK